MPIKLTIKQKWSFYHLLFMPIMKNHATVSYILKQGNGLSLEQTNVGVYLLLISGWLGIFNCLGFIDIFSLFFGFFNCNFDSCIFEGHF